MIYKEKWYYGFYACGPGDNVDASKYPWGWETTDFDDSQWKTAETLQFEGRAPWNLVERNIPFMNGDTILPKAVRLQENVSEADCLLEGKKSVVIPKNTKAKILLDFEVLTMGYPELLVSGGTNARVQINYAEALYEQVNLKAHRDSVNGKTMYGVWDVFKTDGAKNRLYRPLWKRTFRYAQLSIETKEEPLEIQSYTLEYSGYPYKDIATFKSDDETLNTIFEMGQRTLAMCSAETYYDTPFYEQLSYGGDNRPIGNLSFYTTTDDRLFKEVMRLYPQSKNGETKLMKSAYPSRFNFDMGSWSLAWIQSLHDYYFFRGDAEFVASFIGDIEGVLNFYDRHINEENQLIGSVNNQNFMDWSITTGSIPRANEEGDIVNSTMLSLFYLHTLDCTLKIYKELGVTELVDKWSPKAEALRKGIFESSWNTEKQLLVDTPNTEVYSQHSNILAILTDVIPVAEQEDLLLRIINEKVFEEYASSWFSFFLFKAMEKTNRQDLFLENLGLWENFIAMGHTTIGETSFASHDRSDCHAWSAHPAMYLLRFTAGVYPKNKGFEEVLIQPNLGHLKNLRNHYSASER